MAELDGRTIGGVVLIGIGGYVLLGAYQRFQIRDYWEMLGRAVAGSALIYGGIWLFQSRIAGQKEEIK